MSKFQPPMLNDDVCRAPTDKQTHKHTYTHIPGGDVVSLLSLVRFPQGTSSASAHGATDSCSVFIYSEEAPRSQQSTERLHQQK